MGEKVDSQDRDGEAGRWAGVGAAALKPAAGISGQAWLRLFLATQGAMIAAVLFWTHALWLPILCDALMAGLTFVFAADRLRRAKPDVRMIWIMLLCAMALLCVGHLLQFWELLRTEIYLLPTLKPATVSALGLGWGSLFVCARVPFLFLFAQIDEHDDTLYFRVIDGLQSILVVCLATLVYSPSLLGAQPLPAGQSVLLLSLVFPLLSFFGLMNWLGRDPGYGRQLVGAIILYLLAKSVATPLLQEARTLVPVVPLLFQTLPHVMLVMAALHKFPPARPLLSAGQRQAIRFLNPVCFMIASLCQAGAVMRYNQLLGGALMLLSLFLFVLRSSRWQSDFHRLQAATAEAAQARTDFLLDINHEIRSPLTSITLNAGRLNREARLSGDQAALTRSIHKGAELVISTLNDILDISRLESGQVRIPLGPFDAVPVIEETADLLEPQARHRNVQIEWQRVWLPPLLGNPERFRQVLINILSNAIRYAPENSKIVIAVEEGAWDSRPSARVIVTDFGEGIPPEQQALLFRRFSQLGPHAPGSSGLGLAISNALVKLMQGKIAFESRPGQTSFWVELQTAQA